MGGYVYHVLNRGVGRLDIFEDEGDYAAFERVLAEAQSRYSGVRLLGYCLMSNHWHLVLWPKGDGELSEFMRWLTVTHTQRWHAHHHTSVTGPLYQGRFKSFPVQTDESLLTVLRYVERNALRANQASSAESWRWGSLWRWENRHKRSVQGEGQPKLCSWPIDRPHFWRRWVNEPQTKEELSALRRSVQRGAPFGGERWGVRTAEKLSLASSLRPIGRPRRETC